MAQKRVRGAAAVFCCGVCAGTMESRKGRASEAPTPLSTLRREICFLLTNICIGSPEIRWVLASAVARSSRPFSWFFRRSHLGRFYRHAAGGGNLRRADHAERLAPHDTHHD